MSPAQLNLVHRTANPFNLFARKRGSWSSLVFALVFALGVASVVTGCNDSDITIPEGCNPAELGVTPSPTPAASSNPSPSPSVAPVKDSILDPITLRTTLLNGNTSVLLSMNQLQQSKKTVEIARGNLLPSINLGPLVQIATSGSFILASVQILLPFLVPSRWFDYFQVKDLLEADKVALQLVKVNAYASAYALYLTIRTDMAVQKILADEASNLAQIEDYVKKAYAVGMASKTDLDLATGRAAQARVNLSKITALVEATEKPAFRHALGLELDNEFTLADGDVPASPFEGQAPTEVLEPAMAQSLEFHQIDFLKRAAENATWSKVFGFINSSSLSGNSGQGGQNSAFSNLGLNENVGFGFAYFPAIQLSQLNEESMKLRQREIRLEVSETLERVLKNLQQTRDWVEAAQQAENSYREAYHAKLLQYKLGLTDLLQVLQTLAALSDASVEVLRAKAQQNLDRVTFHRSMLSDQFESIPGCKFVDPKPSPTLPPSPARQAG